MEHIEKLTGQPDGLYSPLILRLAKQQDKQIFNRLLSENTVSVSDEIQGQLRELIKSQRPSEKIKPEEYDALIVEHLKGVDMKDYGVWVYYSWSRRLVHLLDEEEFIEVRTNRNLYKITKEERNSLAARKIGVIGLSVGQSIALTMVMERICGELRLADFDELELSNMNRIRTGVYNLGLPKVILSAREIAEIDPFVKVEIYKEGLTQNNMHDFFTKGGNLDLVVEVCDSIEIKIASRFKARQLHIPVVMDTNDRGMVDVERFDKEPQRSIFHGLIDRFANEAYDSVEINDGNRRDILFSLVDFNALSERMKSSMMEIGKSISNWPQLASSVVLGGAITTHICRCILLDQHSSSGRYYVDLDIIFNQ